MKRGIEQTAKFTDYILSSEANSGPDNHETTSPLRTQKFHMLCYKNIYK
jgi:hypothetical protein